MNLWMYKYAKYLIWNYESRGFQIRFPGGTSWNGEINSLVVAYEFSPEGKIFFIVVPYDLNSNLVHKQINKKENPKFLAIRKLRKETGLIAKTEDLIQIMKFVVKNNTRHDKSVHTKYFYLLENFSGKFLELENSSLLNRETSTPFMVPGPLLAQKIFIRHLPVLKCAISHLNSKIDRDDYNLMKIAIEKRG